MKTQVQFFILTAIVIGFSACKKDRPELVYDKHYINEIKEARREIFFYMSNNNVPGGSFAIMKDGKLVYSEALGLASKDLEVPTTRNTKFRIGKVSELFTSLIYQMMIDSGTLHPDSSIQHYLPDFPLAPHQVTLSQLANHTSGIRLPSSTEKDWRGLNITLEKGLDNFKDDPLATTPGWFQEQSMYNYNLLGAIMEKVSGKYFHQLLKEYITDTLQLSNTVVDHPFQTITGRTDFYDHNLVAQVTNATFYDLRYRAPSEGLLSTAEDLVKFGNAILHSNLISEAIKNRLFVPVKLMGDIPAQMANGWMILTTKNGEVLYGRTGPVKGGGGALLIFPEEDMVMAGAVNLSTDMDEIPVFQMAVPFFRPAEDDHEKEKE